jgi:hypothetical protein
MTGVAQVLFGHDANGSLVKDAAGSVVTRRSSVRRSAASGTPSPAVGRVTG